MVDHGLFSQNTSSTKALTCAVFDIVHDMQLLKPCLIIDDLSVTGTDAHMVAGWSEIITTSTTASVKPAKF